MTTKVTDIKEHFFESGYKAYLNEDFADIVISVFSQDNSTQSLDSFTDGLRQACRDDRDDRDNEMSKLQVIYSAAIGYEPELPFGSAEEEEDDYYSENAPRLYDYYFEAHIQQEKIEQIQFYAENVLELSLDWMGAHILHLAIEEKIYGLHEENLMFGYLRIDDENETEKVALLKKLQEIIKGERYKAP